MLAVLLAMLATDASRPNILLILADDMGYGDVAALSPDSRIATPHLDRLAGQSLVMTDAHSPCSWCIPTRHSLLTGRLPIDLNVGDRNRAVIADDLATLPGRLREADYQTAMVGKWHLGFASGEPHLTDEAQPLVGGPCDRGFDSYFGIPRSLDQPPYYYIRDRGPVQRPTESIAGSRSEGWSSIQGNFWRKGGIAPGFAHDRVTPDVLDEAATRLGDLAESDDPFFLYVALPSPHTPWAVAEEFRGQSDVPLYGDFVMQVDAGVGRLLDVLDQTGQADDTLVVFTSDNGPVWYETPDPGRDGLDQPDTVRHGHDASGQWRGMKGDAHEGGHRVPFFVRWPGQIEPRRSDALICHADLFATLLELAEGNGSLPQAGPLDSVDFSPHWRHGEAGGRSEFLVRPSGGPIGYALRSGSWKFIPFLGSGGFTPPKQIQPEGGQPGAQLYDLAADPGEQTNLAAERPEKLAELQARYDELMAAYRSQPK